MAMQPPQVNVPLMMQRGQFPLQALQGPVPPLTTESEGTNPDPPETPFWLAPWPYQSITKGPRWSRKVTIREKQDYLCMIRFLKHILKNPGYDQPLAKKNQYFGDKDAAWALNAYNMRDRRQEFRVWAHFHKWSGTTFSMVPLPNANDPQGQPVIDGRLWADRLGMKRYYNHARDLHPGPPAWVSPSVDPWRRNKNAKRLRLICWFHRHEDPNGVWQNDQYSMTVWDRDTGTLTWHDPWPGNNSVNRFGQIRTLWTNCQAQQNPDFWPGMPAANTLVHQQYQSLMQKQLQPGFVHMRPRFSNIACVAIAVWLMNNLEQAGVLVPPDTDDVLSGTRPELIPELAVVVMQTMRESGQMHRSIGIGGRALNMQRKIRKEYRVAPTNVRLRNQLVTKLSAMFAPNGPNVQDSWIINAITG